MMINLLHWINDAFNLEESSTNRFFAFLLTCSIEYTIYFNILIDGFCTLVLNME